MHAIGGAAEVENRELGSVLTIAVGQDAVGGSGPVQIDDRSLRGANAANRLNGNCTIGRVPHPNFNFPPRLITKQPYDTDEVRCARNAGVSDGQGRSRPKVVLKLGL